MRRILVLRGGALGDFIVTLPALALLRQRWPGAQIELVGNATAAEIARARCLLDRVHSQHEARWAELFGDAPLTEALRRWLAEFDLVINYWPDPEGTLERHFPLHDAQTFISAAAMPAQAPAAAHYCEALRPLGLETRDFFYRLPSLAVGRDQKTPTQACIAIHPGSGSPKKNWPVENWRALIELLPAPVMLILGEAERPRWSADAVTTFSSRVQVLAAPPLEELIASLHACRFFLGHDSGISHLAAACEVPSILLFGPTDPAMWAPPASHVRVLQNGPSLAAISVTEVIAACREALG